MREPLAGVIGLSSPASCCARDLSCLAWPTFADASLRAPLRAARPAAADRNDWPTMREPLAGLVGLGDKPERPASTVREPLARVIGLSSPASCCPRTCPCCPRTCPARPRQRQCRLGRRAAGPGR